MPDFKLDPKDLLDLLESRISRLNWGWNFIAVLYLSTTTIVMNIRIRNIPLDPTYKIVFIILLITVFLVNLGGIRLAVNEVLCLEKDIKSSLSSLNTDDNYRYFNLLKTRKFGNLKLKSIGIHLFIDTAIIALILFYT